MKPVDKLLKYFLLCELVTSLRGLSPLEENATKAEFCVANISKFPIPYTENHKSKRKQEEMKLQ